ncbi:hypothetical protein BD779DRAFT_219374 [Infundibulicybe gibba]|nr:hypothetical protein BD779DRAFT_219374 [Infundibulicybe gibba]
MTMRTFRSFKTGSEPESLPRNETLRPSHFHASLAIPIVRMDPHRHSYHADSMLVCVAQLEATARIPIPSDICPNKNPSDVDVELGGASLVGEGSSGSGLGEVSSLGSGSGEIGAACYSFRVKQNRAAVGIAHGCRSTCINRVSALSWPTSSIYNIIGNIHYPFTETQAVAFGHWLWPRLVRRRRRRMAWD